MVKDLGPDVLNLTTDPDNMDPWEDKDGPLFPELDDELEAAKAAGGFLGNSEVLLPVGNSQELAKVLRRKRDADRKVMGTAHHNPEMDSRVYKSQMSLLRPFMPSVTPTGISMSCWTLSWITERIHLWLSPGMLM